MDQKNVSVEQTNYFAKIVKKLKPNQTRTLEEAITKVIQQPTIGSLKSGDLSDVRVYKYKALNQLWLLAYIHEPKFQKITLLAIGSHENFYRDLKRK